MLINENDKNTFDKIWSDGYKKGHYDGSQWADRIRNEDISAGTACFLVRDKRLADSQNYFYTWLKNNGFKKWSKGHGWYDKVDWVYINLNSKIYNPGMPGIGITSIICNHAITLKEFIQIFFIYKKYEGKKYWIFRLLIKHKNSRLITCCFLSLFTVCAEAWCVCCGRLRRVPLR